MIQSPQMKQIETGPLPRRSALRALGILGFTAATFGTHSHIASQKDVQRKPNCAPPAAIENAPKDETLHRLLKRETQALIEQGKQSSFRPEAAFTQPLYETVKKSTFFIQVVIDGFTNNVPCAAAFAGTAWCARREGRMIYLVTNRHIIEDARKFSVQCIKEIRIWRPYQDTEKILLKNFQIATYGNRDAYDLALIRAEISPKHASTIESLPYRDNYTFQKDERVLLVEYSSEFRQATGDDMHFLTQAPIAPIHGITDKNHWYAKSPSNHGASGAPAVIPDADGKPIVVGMVRGGFALGTESYFTLGDSLAVTPMIHRIKR